VSVSKSQMYLAEALCDLQACCRMRCTWICSHDMLIGSGSHLFGLRTQLGLWPYVLGWERMKLCFKLLLELLVQNFQQALSVVIL